MKYTPETGFLLDLSPEIGFLQETRFLCTSLTWKVLYIGAATWAAIPTAWLNCVRLLVLVGFDV